MDSKLAHHGAYTDSQSSHVPEQQHSSYQALNDPPASSSSQPPSVIRTYLTPIPCYRANIGGRFYYLYPTVSDLGREYATLQTQEARHEYMEIHGKKLGAKLKVGHVSTGEYLAGSKLRGGMNLLPLQRIDFVGQELKPTNGANESR
jgi:hypothetical protein